MGAIERVSYCFFFFYMLTASFSIVYAMEMINLEVPFSNKGPDNLCLQFYHRLRLFFHLFLNKLKALQDIESPRELMVKYSRLWSLYLRATTILRQEFNGLHGSSFVPNGSLISKTRLCIIVLWA